MRAADLSIGDTIKVWWGSKSATVSAIRAHDSGKAGWKVADFADGFSMTITPFMVFQEIQHNRENRNG